MRTVYSLVPSGDVINLAGPRCPREVVRKWAGKRDWHDPFYDPLRDLIEATYVEGLNKQGHYKRLEEDVLANGFRNPVMLIAGKLLWRGQTELPPEARGDPTRLVCERLGGSRLYVAQKHGLVIPAVINDFGDACRVPLVRCRLCKGPKWPKAHLIKSKKDLLSHFKDHPWTAEFSKEQGARCSNMPYSHMPANYTAGRQRTLRRETIKKVKAVVAEWLAENDK